MRVYCVLDLIQQTPTMCQVAMAAFSSDRRKPAGRNDRRTAEVSRNLKGALEQAVLLELAPRSQVSIAHASPLVYADCAGRLCCCISLEAPSSTKLAAGMMILCRLSIRRLLGSLIMHPPFEIQVVLFL